ncbi:cytochrome c oxidase subunit II (plasmid) [Paracoccus yeei]|mgnify:FL=1|uniref:cytochrome-c oxidase n=1 Tax=Paracoccus yeei TaxID=147645 RepID=A0A386US67_9RHOB|nr:cytochrome B [Paracoccus yeei]AYF03208.1 cytochrome c oxidase subunit II [Paracoccus yeei]
MGFLGLLLAPNLAGAADLSVLAPAGPAARGIATLWWWMFWGAAAIFAGVMALFLLLLSRPEALRRTSPRLWLLGGGVVFPLPVVTVLTLAALVQGGTLLGDSLTGATPLRIEAEARMWEWRFRYPGTDMPETVNRLHLPVGRDVEIRVTSLDVIHSFWIPRLGGKIDAIPGHDNRILLHADQAGEFGGVCSEYCGIGHAEMLFTAQAHDAWPADLPR